MKTLDRGYYKLKFNYVEGKPTEEKWMHFSRTSLGLIAELSGGDAIQFAQEMAKAQEKSLEEVFDIYKVLASAGLMGYDLEEGNDIDYNEYKVDSWLFEAMQEDGSIAHSISKAFLLSLPLDTETKGKIMGSQES